MNGILFLLLISSLTTDLRRGKIYNMLVFPAMAAGILQRLQMQGFKGLPSLGISLALPLLLLPFWLLGHGLGGGDIKLLLAVSSLLEPVVFIQCMITTFVIGAVLAVVLLAVTRKKDAALPLALPVAAGTMAVLLQETLF